MDQLRILSVGSDRLAGDHVASTFAEYGYVCIVTTVHDAVRELLKIEPWDAVATDLGLPDGSGLDVLTEARRCHPSILAMVLMHDVQAEAVNIAFDLGAVCLVRPTGRERIERFLKSSLPVATRIRGTAESWRMRYALSSAEADVLSRSALGECRDAIAAARSARLATIKRHIFNLLQKTTDESLHGAVERLLRQTMGD